MVQQKLVSSEKTNEKEKICRDEPELRFPEFNEKWETLKLGDFLEFISTNSLSRAKLNLDDGKIKNIHYGDIHTKFPTIVNVENEEIPFINLDEDTSKFKKEQFCKEGDLVIADASEDYADIGKAIELVNVNIDLVAGLHTILARDKSNKTATGFKGYLFLTEDLRKKIKINANGISVLGISKNNIANLDVKLPSKQEQEKISSFLHAIDKKIELLEKKKEISNQTKSSILKSIFDNVSIYSEDVKINNLFSIKKGKGLSKEKIDVNGKYAAILYGELYTKYSEIIESPISFTDYDEGVPSKKGDILIPGSTTTKGIDLVTASVVCEDNIQLGGDINILRKKKELNPIYAATFIKYFMKREILRLTQGSTIIHLYGKDLKDLEIMLPSLKIQNNVANFIKHYNTKENLYNEEINKVKRFKKALLQKMFV